LAIAHKDTLYAHVRLSGFRLIEVLSQTFQTNTHTHTQTHTHLFLASSCTSMALDTVADLCWGRRGVCLICIFMCFARLLFVATIESRK